MRARKIALLATAAFAQPVVGAVRWEILNQRTAGHFPLSNASAEAATTTISSSFLPTSLTTSSEGASEPPSSSSSSSSSSTPDQSLTSTTISIHQTSNSRTNTDIVTIAGSSPSTTSEDFRSNTTPGSPTIESISSIDSTSYDISASSLASSLSTEDAKPHHPQSANESTPVPEISNTTATSRTKKRRPTGVTLTVLPTTTTLCYTPTGNEPITKYSIVYTSTVTYYGPRSDYTPPFPPITTRNYCESSTIAFSTGASAPAAGVGETSTYMAPSPVPSSKKRPGNSAVPTEAVPSFGQPVATRRTITFVTTDKNPSVVYPSDPVPSYNQPSGGAGKFDPQEHTTVPAGGHDPSPQSMKGAAVNSFVVTAQAQQVVINSQTYSNLKPGETTTVTVGDGVFTIYPTAVVGEGATVGKAEPAGTTVSVATPTSTTVGGLPVTLSGSDAIINGTKVKIPVTGSTTEINHESVSIGPGKVVVGSQTMTFQTVGGQQTDEVVVGGEMVTAIGKSIYIFHSTTITYGPGIPGTTEVIDDDTVTIGPSAVIIDNTTIGGDSAEPTETWYEIVGGATITKLSPSFVIIDGTTYTVGPGATTTTKIMGGETITIGPSGASVSDMTLTYPFGSSTVTTIVTTKETSSGTGTGSDVFPVETGNSNSESKGDDSGGTGIRPSLIAALTGLCIAMGVRILI